MRLHPVFVWLLLVAFFVPPKAIGTAFRVVGEVLEGGKDAESWQVPSWWPRRRSDGPLYPYQGDWH